MTGEVVRLTVPASHEYVRIVRLTASGIANKLGFDVDELETLRIAVDELATLVLEAASDSGTLEIDFIIGADELSIEGRAPARNGADFGADDLTTQILMAVIDEYDASLDDGYAHFRCSRRLPAG